MLKKEEETLDLKVQSARSVNILDRMIISLVFDEAVVDSSGPRGAEKVSTANRQSELRH